MPTIYLALGSNLGDRAATIAAALKAVARLPGTRVLKVSRLIETAPVGGPPGQGPVLNGAATIETDLAPPDLLAALKRIERDLGRTSGPRWGPRPIDLDILLYADLVLDAPALVIPHPRLRERRFVLEPLAEIAGEVRDPVTGRTVKELLARLSHLEP
jgi:2-amino-4-hydroxy-6-hydroxymethyldihydropteridine diphosphokinase